MQEYLYVVGLIGLVALFFVYKKFRFISGAEPGNERMTEISSAIHDGAMAFLFREYRIMAVFVAVVFFLIFFLPGNRQWVMAVSFVSGAVLSVLSGFIGMQVATRANVKTAQAAKKSMGKALTMAFSSGSVMGLSVVGLGIIGIASLYLFFPDPNLIIGFSFGASSVALFARVGGGIYTKAADVGADLVGKVEAGIPEDDPRNPAVIADNVGDNVGDVAGMGADLFESYVGSILATMVLALVIPGGEKFVVLPLLIAAVGILASIIGNYFVYVKEESKVGSALNRGMIASSIALIPLVYLVIKFFAPVSFVFNGVTYQSVGIFYATIAGLTAGVLIGFLTEYYTSYSYKPTKDVSKSALTGAATTIIEGLSSGMMSTVLPVLAISAAIFVSYYFAGIYGIAISAVGMLSTLGLSLAVDAYGPVADNAGGIAEMSNLPATVRKRTDTLDSLGNTTAAMGKGFAIGSAALTALALFSTYVVSVGIRGIDLLNPLVTIGLLIGGSLPFLFTALTLKAVGRAANRMIEEVRRQFKQIKGLMQGKAKPDNRRCVDIATRGALRQMVLPALLAVIVPILTGIVLGAEALGGFLAGSLVTGVLLAIMMANAGGSWDNAKKFIEKGNFGGKGSEAHKAAVVGDTVGDPFKDTSGPAINILIKLMSIVSVVFANFILAYSLIQVK